MNRSLAFLVGLLSVGPFGCDVNSPQSSCAPIRVAVSIPPCAWLVEQVGGEHVAVTVLVSPEESAHTYQPTDAQVSEVMRCRAYFRIGVGMEQGPWFGAIRRSGRLEMVDLRDGIDLRDMQDHRHGRSDGECTSDPHIWLVPRLLKAQSRVVAETLGRLAPEMSEFFRRGQRALAQRLDDADRRIREELAPIRGSAFCVFHPAWSYFAAEYGLRQMTVEVSGNQPTDRQLTELQRLSRAEGIGVIFVQRQFRGESAKALARAIGGRIEYLDPLARDVIENLLETAKRLRAAHDDR